MEDRKKMKMKKTVCLLLTGLLTVGALTGCGGNSDSEETGAKSESAEITVVSREDGSGTRGAFIELFGIEEKDENTEKVLKANIKPKRRNRIEYFDLHPEIPLDERNNYHIDNNNLGVGTPKQKFRRNVEAIKILKQCNEENRYATQEEQQILAEYVGWGGLADAFDPQNDGWSEEYKELKSLLTEKEYSEARQSTLTAFYTPPVVISSIYKALEKMGLEKGNILEPSCRSW